jgi:Outer membrane protein beta-barrel domain
MTLSGFARTSASVVVAVVVVGIGHAAAQTPRRMSAAVLAGVNFARLSLPLAVFPVDEVPGASISNNQRIGLLGGVAIDVPASAGVAFETGALLSFKGSSVDISVPSEGTATIDLRMIYVDVPTMARVGIVGNGHARAFLIGGPVIGLRAHARTKIKAPTLPADADTTQAFTSEVPFFDVGLAIGGRVVVGHALVEVRYTHGLRDIANAGDVSVKHRVISCMAGWAF